MRRVYLDYAATTPTLPEVVESMKPYFSETYGNPSSIHYFGQMAKKAVEEARHKVADLIGAQPEEIIFTSGGTESDNFALWGVAHSLEKKGNHIITSSIEHHAILECCHFMEKRGFKITYLPVDKFGFINLDDLKKAINKQTILISIMHANNEIGTVEEISSISKIAKENNIYFHTDAVQTVGAIPVEVDELGVDLLSLSGHKLYGPKGVGALYVRKGTRITRFLQGGEQENRRRSGTENVPAIVGLGKACEIAKQEIDQRVENLTRLRDKLIEGIKEKIDRVYFNGHPHKRLPNNVNICVEFVEGESMLLNLDLKGIAASSGSACTSGSLEPSHVLLAIGLPVEVAHGSLRFTLGKYNTEEDIYYTVDTFKEIVDRLRAMSPFKKSWED